ncbi:MAG: glycosyltransferase family 1 protein [Eggerthellaceae bacterium]|nr:glycosyltransferase family 1 protein [Eggerthellaceae bacterium]
MNVLVIPMFALSRMGGPWSRAQSVASAFEQAGHHVVLGMADDGNCVNPCVPTTCQLPVPSPLGLPMAIASKTFPLAEKLGISGRKPVHSFEEVLWLTGALAREYERASISAIYDVIERHRIDVVYSEYSVPAIIAARSLGIPVFGSFSYTTQTSYASDPGKAGDVRELVRALGLPDIESSLELFDWLDRRFVPSCRELEPIEGEKVEFVGFMRDVPDGGNGMHDPAVLEDEDALSSIEDGKRNCIVVYLGAGSVPQRSIERVVASALRNSGRDVYVAGCASERQDGRVRFAPRFDFSQLLPRACCFVHHGGQNSTMDALAYGVPQVVVPGRVFERIYNAESIERVGAGVRLEQFNSDALRAACERVVEDASCTEAALTIRQSLSAGGGAARIVQAVEDDGVACRS